MTKPARWSLDAALALGIGLAAISAYVATIPYALVWDDLNLLQIVNLYLEQGGVSRLLTAEIILEPGTSLGLYRPVMLLSLWLDSLIRPAFPHIFHLTNVLLHAVNSVLAYWFIRRLTAATWPAAAAALLFALTPVHTEAVAFVSGRTDLLAAPFLLFAVFAWIADRQPPPAGFRQARLLGLCSFTLACLTKETSWVLPGVLLAWDAIEARRDGRSGRSWAFRNRFWAIGWVTVLALVAFLRWGVARVSLGFLNADGEAGVLSTVPTLLADVPLRALVYVRLLTIPWPLKTYYTAADLAPTIGSLAAMILFLAVFGFLAKRGDAKGWQMLAWTAGFLLPTLKIVPFGGATVADRYLYIPAVGFFLAVGLVIKHLTERPALRPATYAAAGLAIVLFGAGTLTRQAVWRDSLSLFGNMAATSPTHFGGHVNLGVAYNEAGRHEDALRSLQTALALAPDNARAYYNLGSTYAALGRYTEAIAAYRRALLHNPRDAQTANNLGASYLAVGRSAEAVSVLQSALRDQADDPAVCFNLGNAYLGLGRHDEAISAYLRAIRVRRNYPEAYFNLGIASAASGRFHQAAAAYRQLLLLSPGNPKALVNLGIVLGSLGERPQAARLFREAIAIDPGNAAARHQLELVLLGQGEPTPAAANPGALPR